MIEFNNVTKKYSNGYVANRNISFSIKKGEIVGLVGPNGSGKTTLLRQLFRLLETTEGKILVDGMAEDYMNLISYVPQFAAIYPSLTVEESIDATLRYQGDNKLKRLRRIEEVLELLDMQKLRKVYTYMLSGGQQKLLSFACGIATDKPYLILDEVTSMVDIITKEKIWSVIKKLKKKKGIILASHDMEEVKQNCTSVVVLKKGNVIFHGKPEEIKTNSCKGIIAVQDKEKIVKYLTKKEIVFGAEENDITITTNTLDEMIQLIYELKSRTMVAKFECEYPGFYEGVMKIVKEN